MCVFLYKKQVVDGLAFAVTTPWTPHVAISQTSNQHLVFFLESGVYGHQAAETFHKASLHDYGWSFGN